MSRLIAVKGCELQFASGKGVINITSKESATSFVKENGIEKGIYFDKISFSVTGYIGNGITDGDGMGAGEISGTANFILEDKTKKAVVVGDSVTVTLTGSSAGIPGITTTDVVSVSSAGQNLVSLEK